MNSGLLCHVFQGIVKAMLKLGFNAGLLAQFIGSYPVNGGMSLNGNGLLVVGIY